MSPLVPQSLGSNPTGFCSLADASRLVRGSSSSMGHVLLDLVFALVWISNEFTHGLLKNELSIP